MLARIQDRLPKCKQILDDLRASAAADVLLGETKQAS